MIETATKYIYRRGLWDFTVNCSAFSSISALPHPLLLRVAVSPQLLWEGVGTIRNRQSGKARRGREGAGEWSGESITAVSLFDSLSVILGCLEVKVTQVHMQPDTLIYYENVNTVSDEYI